MHLNVHFYTRQAAREFNAGRVAVTEKARERHLGTAYRYQGLANELEVKSNSSQVTG
jgi:hypothetical protein